jgi:serine/threonine protein kinase
MEEQPCHVNIDSPTPTTPPHQQVEGTTSPPFHSHEELSLAEESIEKLVAGSKFFPPFAATDDWFRGSPREGVPLKDLVSALTQQVVTTHVRTLHEHEIRVEKLLGRGGFCEVRRAYLDRGARSNVNKDGDQGNKPIGHGQEYAIKYLLPEISQTKSRKFRRGTADLAIEARFLSLLSHDNIIRLHYVSAGSLREIYHCLDSNETSEDHGRFRRENQWGGSTASCDGKGCGRESKSKLRHNYGYFLVLEHLHETLDNRIKHTFIPEVKLITGMDPLKHHDNHCCITSNCIVHQNACPNRRWSTNLPQWMQYKHSAIMSKNESLSNRMKNALAKRLLILKEIAHAILYLHEHHIVLRDIKPDNIGFFRSSDECEEDVPKLFDFGLVAELKESNKVVSATCFGGHHHCGDDVYKLTGCTG